MERGARLRGLDNEALDAFVRIEVRERQKRELRRERDRIVLDLADQLGTGELARTLGTTAATAEALVGLARERASASTPQIAARRLGRDPDRWREADRHYEELGSTVRPPTFPPLGS